jgi:hypothetical protein
MELLSRDLKSMKVNLTSSLASTITRFGRQWTSLVISGD